MKNGFQTVVRAPMWLVQLLTGAKSFRDNPILGNRRLNEMGLHAFRRRRADAAATYRRRLLADGVAATEREAFDKNGYVIRKNALPLEAFAALRQEVATLRTTTREMRQGGTVTRRIGLDRHLLDKMRVARSVVDDPSVLGLIQYAASYGGEPTFQIQSVIAEGNGSHDDPQTSFHADTFHPTAKAWLFLEDVGEEDGPFAYVPGSHRLTPKRLEWERAQSIAAAGSADKMHAEGSFRISERDFASIDLPPPIRMTVSKNTLVIADTSGFHARSPSLRSSHRVEIYATLRRNPFLPWTGGHVLAMPPISGRHASIEIGLQRMFASAGLGRGAWTVFDEGSPFDPPRL